jgi:4-hydroxybenzoate polyprenyltransferase
LNHLLAFLRLIRWPNLVFIVLTQVLFYFCIQVPVLTDAHPVGYDYKLELPLFGWLVLSSVCIAAAGYIINDYFDLNIDQVNKPQEVVIQKFIRRRWAILWHLSLSTLGVVLAFYVGAQIGNPMLGLMNLVCVLLLWIYSTSLKKQLLIGNVVISLLTAWVILVLYFSEVRVMVWRLDPVLKAQYQERFSALFKYAMVYAGFAFIISLVREAVKDMEDMEGDRKYGAGTLPIVWGVPATQMYVAVWMVVLIVSIAIVQVYGLMKGWYIGSVYTLLTVLLPAGYVIKELFKSQTPAEFHQLSRRIKWVMLAGILSMFFFKFYA